MWTCVRVAVCACSAAASSHCELWGCRPLWNDELTKLVGYSQEDIADCFSKVWAFYIECFPSEASTADAVHAQYAQSPDGVTQI